MGADAALLIAAVLPNNDLAYLLKSAAKLRLQILIEVHTVAGALTPRAAHWCSCWIMDNHRAC